MPIVRNYKIHQNDPSFNENCLYMYIENEKRKGGDPISSNIRNYTNIALPLTIKRSGGKGVDSYYDDEQYVPIVYQINADFTRIAGVLNAGCVVIFPFEIMSSEYIVEDHFNLKCPKFYKHFSNRLLDILEQYKPRKYPYELS